MKTVVTAPAFGFPKINPVGGFIAGPFKACCIHEGFKAPNRMVIFFHPIIDDPFSYQRQNVTCQMGHSDPRQNQKTRVVRDQVNVLLT